MAKQRPQVKTKPPRKASVKASGAASAHRGSQPTAAPRSPAASTRAAAPQPAPQTTPGRRSTYLEAVATYEKGLAALQQHDFAKAMGLLESVLRIYPEERDLHERVKLYLNVCQKQVAPQTEVPQTVDERLLAATVAINGGRHEEAISHLRLVRDEDPDNDHALYMLAVALTLRGERAEAIAHLDRAIAINPENRALARREPDFEPLRSDDAFRAAIEGPSAPRVAADRRRPLPRGR